MKDSIVLDEMVKRKIIPVSGSFKVTQKFIDSFYSIYRELYPRRGGKQTKSNERFAKKLAGLSLLKLVKQRQETTLEFKEVSMKSDIEAGFVYIISNPSFPEHVKIGMTKDIKRRISAYQTCDPFKAFKIEHYRFFENVRDKEREILNEFKVNIINGEWINKEVLKKILKTHFTVGV